MFVNMNLLVINVRKILKIKSHTYKLRKWPHRWDAAEKTQNVNIVRKKMKNNALRRLHGLRYTNTSGTMKLCWESCEYLPLVKAKSVDYLAKELEKREKTYNVEKYNSSYISKLSSFIERSISLRKNFFSWINRLLSNEETIGSFGKNEKKKFSRNPFWFSCQKFQSLKIISGCIFN